MSLNKELVRIDTLSTDRLNGEFDNDLIICPICTDILWKPMTLKHVKILFV